MALTCKQIGEAGCVVFDGKELIAEIRALRLIAARFRPGGRMLFGLTVPIPLFWMQYANHEDPERNAGSSPRLAILATRDDAVVIECVGTTGSGAWKSRVVLSLTRTFPTVAYHYTIDAELMVIADYTVTPNPDHGELEFANLWPHDTFVTDAAMVKRYHSCLLDCEGHHFRIPHHHLESSDKHAIPMHPGDRFLWVLEEENPCLTLESEQEVTAGICAYMWDAHFAYRVCQDGKPSVIPGGTSFQAKYRLTGVPRDEASRLVEGSSDRPASEIFRTPIYVDGVNTFSATLPSSGEDQAWPWENEGDAVFSVDHDRGYDDTHSLRIDNRSSAEVSWKATTLGPAYGKPGFRPGSRFRFSTCVAAKDLAGSAGIAIRLHREGAGSVFDLKDYETFNSSEHIGGTCDWVRLEATTPPISPAPDRLHLLLLSHGPGTTWFDNAYLEVLP